MTVAVNSFLFKEPVFVGDLVSFYARVVKVGRTSITVDVEVFAQRGRDGRTDVVQGHRSPAHLRRHRRASATRARCPDGTEKA